MPSRPYAEFFLNPGVPRHRNYEVMRARFVDNRPVQEIAEHFGLSFLTVQGYIRNFKKAYEDDQPLEFFIPTRTGPKSDRKKSSAREHIIRLRARGYANTDIGRALKLAGKDVSISLIDQVLREEGLIGLRKRSLEERERVKAEIRSKRIPGLTIPVAMPEIPEVANLEKLDLSDGRKLYSRVAGVYLFLPFLASMKLPEVVDRAGMPGSKMIPPVSYFLSLLALKLLNKERKSHIADWNFDEGLGLFAGLNVLPKNTPVSDYSYRLDGTVNKALLESWVAAALPKLCPDGAESFALDFHAIPYREQEASLENHYVPKQGKATNSILSFFVRSVDTPLLCYANADVIRTEEHSMPLEFIAFWKKLTGVSPNWLYFDSKLTTYTILNQLNELGINFITIRRRGQDMVTKLLARPAADWKSFVIDTPQRRHQKLRCLDDEVTLTGYNGKCRQITVTGLGRKAPTLFLTNNTDQTARKIVSRYISRNTVEDELGINVNFFHMDCLSSEVRLNVDLDVLMTVVANNSYRWLSQQLKGCEKMKPKQLCRKFIETGGHISIDGNTLTVKLDRRSHNPVIQQACLDQPEIPIPWLGGKRLRLLFS
jgi:hypothetical protein